MVYWKRPRQWALSSPVIPMRRVDERYSRLQERIPRSSSDVKCATFDMMSRKITVLDASAMRCMASAMSEVAAELQNEGEHAKSRCLENCRIRCLECEKKCAIGRKKLRQVIRSHYCRRPRSPIVEVCRRRS